MVRLKDGGLAIDWSGLTGIKAWLFSDAQKAICGRFDVAVNQEDNTLLKCDYSATKPQYLGVNRIIIQAKYHGRVKTYDKALLNFVSRTSDVPGDITIEDPIVDVEIDVQDVSSSILDSLLEAMLKALDEVQDIIDIHRGPQGPQGETGATGPQGPAGPTGATPAFTVGTVTTGEPGTPVVVTITGTAEAPVLNITIPQGMQGNTGSSVDYPFELVDNLTTDDATKALSAAQGVVLDEKVSQLQQKIQRTADGMIDVAQYNRDEKLPEYIDNTTYQYSTPRLNRDYIASPAIKVSSGDKVVLTESASIAQFTSGGSIRVNASASELTISSAATAYIRVAIPKATDGFTVKINGTIVLIWSAELYEAIQASKSSDSMVHSTEESGGSRSYFPALFNGTIGNPGNTSLIRTELIPVVPGSTVWVRPNIELEQGQTYAHGYKTYKSDGSLWRSVDVSSNGVANQVYATTDVEYYVAFEIGVYDASNSAVAIRAATYQGKLDVIVKSPAQIDAWKYRTLVGQLSYSPSMNSYQQSNPLVLLHFSDLHGSGDNFRRIVGFRRVMKELIHDVISTGDNVFTSFADSFDFWSDRTVLNAIGNHDTAKLEGGSYDWTYYAGKQAYDRYFAPFISRWGVIQPENAAEQGYCYYYKDYTAQGIRLVVLDVMGWDAVQLAWFGNVLSDATTKSLSVVVAIHGPAKPDVVTPMSSGWMSYFGWSGSSDTIPDDAISAIDSFIESNGKFICWLTGHTHRDQLGYLAEHHNQLCMVIGTATINATNAGYGDSYRKVYEESQDLFNVIAFDAKEHQVRVVRVGATTNKHFQMRNTLVVSYSEDGRTIPTIISDS